MILYALNVGAQSNKALSPLREKSKAFYTTEEARRIGDQVLLYQRTTGGWPKNIDMARPLSDEDRQRVERDRERLDDSTRAPRTSATAMPSAEEWNICSADSMKMADGRSSGLRTATTRFTSHTTTVPW